MNMRRGLLIFIFATTSLIAAAQQPREPFWLGGGVGYGLAFHSINDPGIACNSDPACPKYTGGLGSGALFGVSADWIISPAVELLMRGSYFASSATLNVTIADAMVRDANNNVVPLTRTHSLTASVPEFTIDVMQSWRIKQFRLFAGPTASLLLSPQWGSTAQIISPNNVTYANNLRDTTLLATQAMPNARSLLIALTVGAGWDYYLSRKIIFTPELSFTLPLQSLRSDVSWTESSLRLTANVRFGMFGPCDIREVRDSLFTHDTISVPYREQMAGKFITGAPIANEVEHEEDCLHRVTLVTHRTDTIISQCLASAALHVMAIEPDGSRGTLSGITVQTYKIKDEFPVLPFIYFDDTSAALPQRYHQLAAKQPFAVDNIFPDAITLHHELLNILAERLNKKTSAILIVHGYSDPMTERSDCDLALRRGESIKNYLVTRGVKPSQIIVRTANAHCVADVLTMTHTPDGYADNRRALLESDDPEILQPILRTHALEPKLISPPALEFDPAGSNPCTAQHVAIQAMQGSAQIFAMNEPGAPHTVVHQISKSEANMLVNGAPLKCTIAMLDEHNAPLATTEREFVIHKDTSAEELQRLSLTLFDVMQDQVREGDKRMLAKIAKKFDSTTVVRVIGYTDNIGEPAFNVALSQKRAKSVAAYIKTVAPNAKFVSEGYGSAEFPPGMTSYTTPEERQLCRTVRIEITGIK